MTVTDMTAAATNRSLRVVAAGVVAAAVLAALLAAAPATAAAQDGFSDVSDTGVHSPAIAALDDQGVFDGTLCGEGLFCPTEPLSRAHMAVWLVRVLDGTDPAAVTGTRFADVDGDHPYAAFIERFAQLGVTRGCGDGTNYCPDLTVTRAQMAAFLTRAYDLEAAEPAGFADVPAGGVHAADIDALAAAKITLGCGDGTNYCPQDDVTRAQMATFLVRADDYAWARAGAYREPKVVLDNGWVVYGTGYVPPLHPDTPTPSWIRGTWELGDGPDARLRATPAVRAWVDWCGAYAGCGELIEHMWRPLDFLGADENCVVEQYERRVVAARRPGVTDGWNNGDLINRHGWHRCATVIDPIQPDGRLLSEHGLTMVQRCRAVLPADTEFEEWVIEYVEAEDTYRGRYLPLEGCDEWGAWAEDRSTGFDDCDYSARLAEEWMEHNHDQPLRFPKVWC